jgi:hypothetical protein
MKKKIAVIGGGIYGITLATKLDSKHHVDLYEKEKDILQGASGINQFRLHRGYHYPRSNRTTADMLRSEPMFKQEYSRAIMSKIDHFYCIAKHNSLTSKNAFINYLKKWDLEYKPSKLSLISDKEISLCVKVKENLIDPQILHTLCWEKLKQSKVKVLLNTKATKKIFNQYDHIINATYSSINNLLSSWPSKQRQYQFEICEKIVVKLPSDFKNKSIVIMDGPFMCSDPYGKSGNFLMGHVVHAIHHTNTGIYPQIPKVIKPLLNQGIIKNPPVTNFPLFIESASAYIPLISQAKHVGSMYTIRTVLPHKDATDERPTIVRQINKKVINIFSGKISTCVEIFNQVAKLIEAK